MSSLRGCSIHSLEGLTMNSDATNTPEESLVEAESPLIDPAKAEALFAQLVKQQNLPVTIKYPEMVAQVFPFFEGDKLPDFGKNNLWFL